MSTSSHLARFTRTYASPSMHSCIDDASLRAKVTNFSPFRGCRDTRRDFLRYGAAREIAAEGRARSRFLRHAQWARCDTRAIIRARRLDTFNCHVNLFVPLPIEGGRALSRERARESSPRPAKNPASSTRTTHNGPFTT